jgi:hypothetical protein
MTLILSSKEMHGATIADPYPIAKTAPMKITQTFRPGYPVTNLKVSATALDALDLEFFKAYHTFCPDQ